MNGHDSYFESTDYKNQDKQFDENGEEDRNYKYDFTTCKVCGGREVTRSYMVPDGEDDVDWDFDSWCENPNCPSNKIIDSSKL
jgi:hypothetical protein